MKIENLLEKIKETNACSPIEARTVIEEYVRILQDAKLIYGVKFTSFPNLIEENYYNQETEFFKSLETPRKAYRYLSKWINGKDYNPEMLLNDTKEALEIIVFYLKKINRINPSFSFSAAKLVFSEMKVSDENLIEKRKKLKESIYQKYLRSYVNKRFITKRGVRIDHHEMTVSYFNHKLTVDKILTKFIEDEHFKKPKEFYDDLKKIKYLNLRIHKNI